MSLDSPGSLSTRIEEFVAFRRSQGMAKGTIRNDVRTLRTFMQVNGNILLKSVDDGHVTKYLEKVSQSRGASALRNDHQALRTFFDWARRTKRMPIGQDPMAGRRAPKVWKKERLRVPVAQFPDLLDASTHPRDRMVIALGLYLFLRSSEMATLRVGDLSLPGGEILINVQKSRTQDLMPVCAELDEELRRWLTYYTKECGKPQVDWHLVPAKTGARWRQNKETKRLEWDGESSGLLKPTVKLVSLEKVSQRALKGIGIEVRDPETGKRTGEGIHTLRRSGARAMFDALQTLEDAPSYPIRPVQAMLHHKNQNTTEEYIGLEPDRWERDKLLRGRVMYRVNRENVVDLREVAR